MKKKILMRLATVLTILSMMGSFVLGDFLGLGKIFSIEGLLKTAGIGVVVSKFGPNINTAVNSLVSHKDADQTKTKVVPILTIGSGAAIGAVQVIGAPKQVDQVTAVAQFETNFFKVLRIRALVPISSRDLKKIHRVHSVGVSAIIDSRY